MNRTCFLCRERPPSACCYVRRSGRESAACRMCWEQVFLDPRRMLLELGEGADHAPEASSPRS